MLCLVDLCIFSHWFVARCRLPRDNTNCVNYVDVLSSLNWRDNPAPPMGEQTNRPDEAWQGSRGGGKVDVVCYSAFIKDLGSS